MKLHPIREQIVVKRKNAEEKSIGGIIIHGTAQEKSIEGEVLAVGSGKVLNNGMVVTPEVKVGDRILFNKHGFIEVKIDNEDYLVIREDAILGTIIE